MPSWISKGVGTCFVAALIACSSRSVTPPTLEFRDADPPPVFPGMPSDAVVPSAAVGTLAGGLSVTPFGSARYGVPLLTPEGRSGFSPSLALEYDSRAGNGTVGVGFRLVGLSSVSRCRRTMAQDSMPDRVAFDESDRFCLDGTRLVAVSGVYGADGTEYRTEAGSQTKIVSHGSFVSGPAWFEVHHPDGTKARYETRYENRRVHNTDPTGMTPLTADSTPSVLSWHVSEITDRNGNRIVFSYDTDPPKSPEDGAEILPTEIAYNLHGTSEDPHRFVRFVYESRDDVDRHFVSGFAMATRKRLRSVQMYAPWEDGGDAQRVRSYELGYGTGVETRRSRLDTIQECDGAGVCKPKTHLEWTDGSWAYESIATDIDDLDNEVDSEGNPRRYLEMVDLDADGRDDLVYRDKAECGPIQDLECTGRTCVVTWPEGSCTGGAWMTRRSLPADVPTLGDGVPLTRVDGTTLAGTHTIAFVDIDRDGTVDVMHPDDDGVWSAYRNLGDGALETWQELGGTPLEQFNPPAFALDLDGDGRTDFATVRHDSAGGFEWIARLNTGATPEPFGPLQVLHPVPPSVYQGQTVDVADVDGDGVAQLVSSVWTGTDVEYVAIDLRPHTPVVKELDLAWSARRRMLDIDGDGLRDVVGVVDGTASLRRNLGDGFGPWQPLGVADWCPYTSFRCTMRIRDFNADGREDMLHLGPLVSRLYVSEGETFREVLLPGDGMLDPDGHGGALGDIDGDGRFDIVRHVDGTSTLEIMHATEAVPDRLRAVVDGLGRRDEVDYRTASDPAVYRPGTSCTHPQTCAIGSMALASELRLDDGNGGHHTLRYWYADGRVDVTGGNFIGFGRTVEHDVTAQRFTERLFDVDTRTDGRYPLAWAAHTTTTLVKDATDYARVDRSTLDVASSHPGVHEVRQTLHEGQTYEDAPALDPFGAAPMADTLASLVPTRASSTTYADFEYGMPTSIEHEVHDGGRTTIVDRVLEHRLGDWQLGFVTEHTTTSIAGASSHTRTQSFEYDPQGNLTFVRWTGGDGSAGPGTKYVHDPYGNVAVVERTDDDGNLRRTIIDRDDEGQYVRRIEDALGHVRWLAVHPALGVTVLEVDVDGVTREASYDGFGRLRRRDGPGQAMVRSYSADPSAALRVDTAWEGGGTTSIRLDRLQREVSRESLGFDGRIVKRQWVYDSLGRQTSESRPHFVGEPAYWIKTFWDNRDRAVRVEYPDATSIDIQHLAFETWVDGRGGRRSYTRRGVDGDVVLSVDILEGRHLGTSYSYGPFGVLRTVTDSEGNVTTLEHDELGRRTSIADPDLGTRQYVPNGFGELDRVLGAYGDTRFERDDLGRIVGVDTEDGLTELHWDDAPGGVGRLHWAQTPDGTRTTLGYDGSGHLAEEALQLPDGSTYVVGYDYDAAGRIARIDYPEIPGLGRPAVAYAYNAQGFVEDVHDADTGTVYWRAEGRAADSGLTQEKFGNGATSERVPDPVTGRLQRIDTRSGSGAVLQEFEFGYDAAGNVEMRRDGSTVEHFVYDDIDRLTGWTVDVDVGGTLDRAQDAEYHYDDLGNLLRRIDSLGDLELAYGDHGDAGPHAVTRVGGEIAYDYDALGRQVAGPGRTIEFDAWDLPREIADGEGTVSLTYDAFGRRVRSSGPQGITDMVLELYERREGPTTEHVLDVRVGPRAVAQVEITEATGDRAVHYLHDDPLGSVTVVTDETGVAVDRRWYSPFGRRVEDGHPVEDPADLEAVRHGFTGHAVESTGATIDMRGRVYDPHVGVFLSPDPLVARVYGGQFLNRYRYVVNNPLRWVDPSGYEPDGGYDNDWDDWDDGWDGDRGDNDNGGYNHNDNYDGGHSNENADYAWDDERAPDNQDPWGPGPDNNPNGNSAPHQNDPVWGSNDGGHMGSRSTVNGPPFPDGEPSFDDDGLDSGHPGGGSRHIPRADPPASPGAGVGSSSGGLGGSLDVPGPPLVLAQMGGLGDFGDSASEAAEAGAAYRRARQRLLDCLADAGCISSPELNRRMRAEERARERYFDALDQAVEDGEEVAEGSRDPRPWGTLEDIIDWLSGIEWPWEWWE